MLKLNYIESGLHLERLATPLETVVQERVLLALRLGQTLYIEPSRAAFLLPIHAPELAHLEQLLRREQLQNLSLFPVDDEFAEISLEGTWIAPSAEAEAGTFLAVLSDEAELFVEKLWTAAQSQVSSLA